MASIALNIYFLVLVLFLFETVFTQSIPLGSKLSPTVPPTSWRSHSGLFSFGFYKQGDGFKVGIWLSPENNKTIVWTANRDDPPVSSNASLILTINGELLLQTGQGQKKVIAHSTNNGTVFSAFMNDSGNFVLKNKNSDILWQSFDHPTDSLLGGQILPSGGQLVSSSSNTNQSSGRFILAMQGDGNLVLYTRYSEQKPSDAYWASQSYEGTGFRYYLYLDNTDHLLYIVNASNSHSQTIWNEGDSNDDSNFEGKNPIYRTTIDSDGILRLYAHFEGADRTRQVIKLWSPPELDDLCEVKTFCGFNSYCAINDNKAYCTCLPGTDFIDPSNQNLGCKRNFSEAECKGRKDTASFYYMSPMSSMSMGDLPYTEEHLEEEECYSSCLQDCYCGAAFYQRGWCKKQKLPFRYVRRGTPSDSSGDTRSYTIYFKVGSQSRESNNDNQPPPIKTISKKAVVQIIVVICGFSILLFSAIGISGHLTYKIGVLSYMRLVKMGDLGWSDGITLRVFSYNELKKATNGFRQEVGKGSFGSVYRGTLLKGRKLIAVKRLHRLVEEGEREFQAEMQSIGKTHHKNLVRLLGYCAEGSKRLLVYEYMSNGSLEKLIFAGSTVRPDWDHRRRIALDIAKGLLYLHEQCEAPIIHCDIKPQNILMDEFWTAKISDFGLAKLLMPDQTRTFTQVRGTRGYLAPEWNKNTPITVKADVYSYGVMLLEIVFCRRSLVVNMTNPEQIVLSNWVYKCFVRRELNKLVLGEEVDQTLVENMVKVGLWCIQDEPFLRPSIKSVVLMLEGVTEAAIPPCPSLDST